MAKVRKYDRKKEIRAIARERVGSVPAARPIKTKTDKKKPKYKKPVETDPELA